MLQPLLQRMCGEKRERERERGREGERAGEREGERQRERERERGRESGGEGEGEGEGERGRGRQSFGRPHNEHVSFCTSPVRVRVSSQTESSKLTAKPPFHSRHRRIQGKAM